MALVVSVARRIGNPGARWVSTNQGQTTGEDYNQDPYDDQEAYREDHIDDERSQDVKQRILQASLQFVPQHGWTQAAISAGAESEGLPAIAHGMFSQGGVELVFYFYESCNDQLSRELDLEVQNLQEKIKIKPFIRKAVETRLRMNSPYIEKWPQAMGLLALPQNTPRALKNLGHLVDDMWYHAGDRSTDINWYTKRASLAAVYKSTEFYMVQDKSEDFENTWMFLDRRLGDLSSFGKCMRTVQENGGLGVENMKGLFIVAKNILGLSPKYR
ncbi:hypothetical protein ScPMuIL_001105 [Solemya velum]